MAACRVGDPENGPADERMASYLDGHTHPRHALRPRVAFVATIDERVVGYIAGHLTRRYECDGEVQYLYVAPAQRRAGVASELLRHLSCWFMEQHARRICVDVDPDSPAARLFYASHAAVPNKAWMVWDDISRLCERRI